MGAPRRQSQLALGTTGTFGRLARPLWRPWSHVASDGDADHPWSAPGALISVAGVHGGAGTTTLCLLLAHTVAATGGDPAVAIDLAGRTRGGLAVMAGARTSVPVEVLAAIAAEGGGSIADPFSTNADGVRIVGASPDRIDDLDLRSDMLVAHVLEAARSGADDAHLSAIVRQAAHDQQSWHAIPSDSEEEAAAIASLVDSALAHHALVAVDLGMLDSPSLARMVAARSSLHIWAVPSRACSLEIAKHRLPNLPFESRGREAIAVWHADGPDPSARRLSALSDLRGCHVVRMPNHGPTGDPWHTRLARSRAGLDTLHSLLGP